MRLAILLLSSYLVGSIPTALWLGRAIRGIDVRHFGSGNVGATNALRVFGWKWGLLVMGLDVGKGFVAVLVLPRLLDVQYHPDQTLILVLAGASAILGHIFPVTIGFRGGKGVGTSAGVMFALAPLMTLIALSIWALIVAATRYVSLGSMTAALCLPVMLLIRKFLFGIEIQNSLLVFSLFLALGVIVSHRANIRRLLNGTENRLSLSNSRPKRMPS